VTALRNVRRIICCFRYVGKSKTFIYIYNTKNAQNWLIVSILFAYKYGNENDKGTFKNAFVTSLPVLESTLFVNLCVMQL